MKIKLSIIIIIIIIVVVITIVMSYGSCNCNSSFILNFLKVFSALQTVFSFIIAYLLYDRFGTSKKLLDKQNEIIITYIEELKKIKLYVYTFNKTGKSCQLQIISIKKKIRFENSDLYGNKIITFDPNQYNYFNKLAELASHPLFPIELKNQMNVFVHYIYVNPVFKYTKYDLAYVSFEHFQTDPPIEHFSYSELMEITLSEYIKLLEKLIAEIEVWINKESSIKIKLNFD